MKILNSKRPGAALVLIVLIVLVSGCGQKGQLYRPDPPTAGAENTVVDPAADPAVNPAHQPAIDPDPAQQGDEEDGALP